MTEPDGKKIRGSVPVIIRRELGREGVADELRVDLIKTLVHYELAREKRSFKKGKLSVNGKKLGRPKKEQPNPEPGFLDRLKERQNGGQGTGSEKS